MSSDEPTDVELELLSLARADQATAERLDALTDVVSELAATVDELVGRTPPGLRVPWWPGLDHEEAAAVWAGLIEWLRPLLARRGDLAATLTPCWYRHPVVVDELSMLRSTWAAAYQSTKATQPAAVAEWLDRWLPNARRRIEGDVKECRRKEHVPPTKPRGELLSDDAVGWNNGRAAAAVAAQTETA